ncbi:hypothetical protein GPALN_011182 [Globodera pallida]|nr:hypothetical protein GPALN_011182 [Globodera pallida]
MPGFTCTIIGLKKRLRRRNNAHTSAHPPYFEEFRDEYNGFMVSYVPDGGSLKGKDSRKSAASEGEGAIVNVREYDVKWKDEFGVGRDQLPEAEEEEPEEGAQGHKVVIATDKFTPWTLERRKTSRR